MDHAWKTVSEKLGPDYELCTNPGCYVRRTSESHQAGKGKRWHPTSKERPLPACTGSETSAPTSPILTAEWTRDLPGVVDARGRWVSEDVVIRAGVAAPDMARALLEAWRNTPNAATCVWGKSVRAALLKAGVSEAELEVRT